MGRPFSNECPRGHAKGPGECPRCRRERQKVYMASVKGQEAGNRASKKYLQKKRGAVSYTDNSPQGDPNGGQEGTIPQNVFQHSDQAVGRTG